MIMTINVYDRLSQKAHNEINNLTTEERETLEQLAEDSFSEWISRISDEDLLSYGLDNSLIL